MAPAADELKRYRDFAVELAKDCGDIARRHFRLDIPYETKSDNSPITKADLEINGLVIERCRSAYPDIGVLGEEESSPGSGNLLWVCDPIDGTGPYSFGMSASTFCLALVADGVPVVGVIYDFMHDRMFQAVKGQGAFMDDTALKLPDYQPMMRVNLEWWNGAAVKTAGMHELLFAQGYQVPNFTSSGYMGMQVAMGRIAGQIYMGKSVWDVAALQLIADEAGLRTSNLDGNGQRYDGPVKGLVVTHPEHYGPIFQTLQQARAAAA